jgi:hypothetical protein
MIWRTTSLCTNPAVKRTGGSLWLLRSLALAAALSLLSWGGVALAVDPPCPDGDGDGYASSCDTCTNTNCPTLDCNDGNGSINPGETEKCDLTNTDENCDGSHNEGYDPLGREGGNAGEGYDCADGLDNDGDGMIDLADAGCVSGKCVLTDPAGCLASDPAGCCRTASFTQCQGMLATTCPVPPGGIEMHVLEGPAPDPTCSDFEDNDCDGVIDVGETSCQVTETCNGVDDDGSGRESGASTVFDCNDNIDNDLDGDVDGDDAGCKDGVDDALAFSNLGDACTAGDGVCKNTGKYICTGDGSGTMCSAAPFSAKTEGPPGSPTCSDGLDNDCNNKADLTGAMALPADPSCVGVEKCDGVDNDGNDGPDEDFTDLGDACSGGVGACATSGVKVCSPDQTTTVCNAVPGVASTEGPSGLTCTDVDASLVPIDNDCDGFANELDPGCGSQFLHAECSLPKIRSLPGDDCTQWRTVKFSAGGGSPNTIVTAEILAIDTMGQILASIPVKLDDRAHLASRLPSSAWKWSYNTVALVGNRAEVFAPVPLLRVTAKDGLNKATAYCSIIPYMQVFEPAGQVITNGSGDTMHVETAITLVNPTTLLLKVDGVLLFPNMVPPINPMTAFPGGPYNGTVMINGASVEVMNLKVSSKAVDLSAGNVLTMDLKGMGCGGHIVVVDGDKRPGSFPDKVASTCLVDDLLDKGKASTFKVEIASPTDQSAQPVPTTVMGQVCHGLAIADLKVNGKDVSTAGQVVVPGDGVNTGDKVTLDFSTSLDQTDLAADLAMATTDVDSFDAGSNRAVADATDAEGHRSFDDVIFSTGDVAKPGVPSLAAAAEVQKQIQAQMADRLNEVAAEIPGAFLTGGTELSNAFVIGIKEQALADFFQNKCAGVAQQFADRARSAIFAKPPTVKNIPVPCSCNPPVSIAVTDVTITPAGNTCPIDFVHDAINVTVNLPDVVVRTHIGGWCKETFLGACIDKTVVDMDVDVTLSGIHFGFQITEDQLKGMAGPPADPLVITGSSSLTAAGGYSISCIGADICSVVAEVFTFGAADLSPDLDFTTETAFTKEIGAGEPDPISLGEIKLDELAIAQKEQSAKGMLDEVAIEDGGLTATLKGNFATSKVDPEVENTPGAVLSLPNVVPATPLATADDVYIGIADDVFNQLFASMTVAGKLKTSCISDPNNPITVGNILPADCNTISIPLDTPEATEAAESAAIGLCVGLKEGNCDTLGSESFLLTPVEQGICHGFKGDNCLALAGGLAGFPWPSDCESISLDIPSLPGLSARISALAQGLCHAANGDVCQTLSNTTDELTAVEQGACSGATAANCQTLTGVLGSLALEKATCEGVKGVSACNTLPFGQPLECSTTLVIKAAISSLFSIAEQKACNASPNLNIHAADQLLFCTRADVPPRLLIQDNTSTSPVETALRLNDLSVAMVVDRDNDGLDGELAATPGCFGTGAPTTGDCSLFGVCLDLNFVTEMQFQTCTDGQPGLVTKVQDIMATIRRAGVVCKAAMAGADGPVVAEGATNKTIDVLMDNVDQFTPPACANGFDLGGTVTFSSPRLMSIETDGNTEFQDYLAITGQINP